MRLNASVFYSLHRPAECDRRVYLRANGVAEAEPSPYEEVIREIGKEYELKHLATFPGFLDLSKGSEEERIKRTIDAVSSGEPVIYQPLFASKTMLKEESVMLVGEPDLLIQDEHGYRIRDVKISRRITEKDHPEILLQIGIYGWLFEQALKRKPVQLEVFSGTGAIEVIPAEWAERSLEQVDRILQISKSVTEPYSPVGWTKCGPCAFQQRCWTQAVNAKDVATVPGVDKGLATELFGQGMQTIQDLLRNFNEDSLSKLARPWGERTQKVGKAAAKILRFARAIDSGKEELVQIPKIPPAENYVMFDLEGLPPQLDELEKVFLWGIQVFGVRPGPYVGEIAGGGQEGDKAGWFSFLGAAREIFKEYGDIKFVHWATYEKTKLSTYLKRYGDMDGVGERVMANLLDLLPITQDSIALPLPSYSLKVIEKYVGFKRTQDEYGGDWAMATFIRATELGDDAKRRELLESIRTYNKEDLGATWAVLSWLRTKGA